MFLYETHLHTYPVSACGNASPEEMVRAYKSMGYTGFIVTDHFFNGNTGCPHNLPWEEKVNFFLTGYYAAKNEGATLDFDVFLGWEYAIQGSEFLTYGLTPDFLYNNPNLDKLDIKAYSKLVRKHGGYLAQAHPYRNAFWVKNPHPVAPHLIDGIEAFNASQDAKANASALEFANRHNLPIQSGTDAHSTKPRITGGIHLPCRAANIRDIVEAIKNKKIIFKKP
ncbi:MAG: PHP domain-containing protein [Defluviitaleaceae bacterium]|nr:PHP domain-containing protein [Defluviitaleaceae bacterium]MCL2274407.1 PHP domain-containing protein [Defluviitaleaceae bacterium]